MSEQSPHPRAVTALALVLASLLLAGCMSTSVGPSPSRVMATSDAGVMEGVRVIDLDASPELLPPPRRWPQFSQAFPEREVAGGKPAQEQDAPGERVGIGDSLSITVIEAPPATLFGAGAMLTESGLAGAGSQALPERVVGRSGAVFVPFAGQVAVAGLTTEEVARTIAARLSGKAHLPQVSVALVRNQASAVTVVGDVAEARRVPLTPGGERVLDAIAAAGGASQPVHETLVQITRGPRVVAMPLDTVIRDPAQNVRLRPGDVVSTFARRYSFTVLGAAAKSGEVPFDATGITLARALGRVSGLQDFRADPRGLFLFRWEEPDKRLADARGLHRGDAGRIPVIYRIDMKDQATYFLAQNFEMRDGDLLYVANSGISEFRQFFAVIASTVLPVAAVRNGI